MLYTDGTTEATREQAEARLREMDAGDIDGQLDANVVTLQAAIDAATNLNPLDLVASKDAPDIAGTHLADSTMVVVEVPATGTDWEDASRKLIRNIAVKGYGGRLLTAHATKVRMKTSKAVAWVENIAGSV
jgi:hypothetical protein